MNLTEIILTTVLSSGGTIAVLVFASKWFAGILASKITEKDKAKYQKELEDLKKHYQIELETHKKELETSKMIFLKYSENQFDLYNVLWKELIEVKHKGQDLWESASPQNLKSFADQLFKTKKVIEKSALLIEEEHYVNLLLLIEEFSNYQFGKKYLIDYRKKKSSEIDPTEIGEYAIEINRQKREKYISLINELQEEFRNQLTGSVAFL